MKKLTALALAALVLTGCAVAPASAPYATPAIEPAVAVAAPAHTEMLASLRPVLTTLKSDDSALIREGFEACANLLFRDKDKYAADVRAKYSNQEEALDHLTVAAAAKFYLCP